ncbi:retinoblastoma-like protein 1 [Amblyomma americanum]
MVLFQHTTEVPQLPTPSTGRNDMHNREAVNRSPLSTATQCASKLQSLLAGRRNTPSEALTDLLSTCGSSLASNITETVKSMGEKFCAAWAQCPPDQQDGDTHEDLAPRQLRLGETLFYKMLENMAAEARQPKSNVNQLTYLSSSVFQRPLFACCLEIVMFCYNSQREFPWILEVFDLMPYHFFKIIEPVIRSEKGLWREVVKHLNNVEEQIVECLAWKANSPLWNAIEHPGQSVPTFEEVQPGRQIERVQESTENSVGKTAPLEDSSSGQGSSGLSKPAVREGCATRSQGKASAPVTGDSGPSTSKVSKENRPPSLPRALVIFFRKVYHLAGMRLQNMCARLPIEGADLQSKIWTCFEHSLVHCTKLMKNRHLDQLLLCAIYIVTKVTKFDTKFQDILHRYRDQYQKKSHVYREVYMTTAPAHGRFDKCASCDSKPYGACENTKVETADIIVFYNNIYRKDMTSYVMKFAPGSNKDETICLTPLPQTKSAVTLPKVEISPNVFVSPLRPNSYVASPNLRAYHFNQSPARDLHEINRLVVEGVENVKRRILLEGDEPEDGGPPPAKRLFDEKIMAVMKDRQAVDGKGDDSGN